MAMIISSISILLIIISCKSPKPQTNPKLQQALENLLAPDLKRVPDSMKSWIYKFKEVALSDQRYRYSPSIFLKNAHAQGLIDSVNERIVMEYVRKYGYPELKKAGIIGILAIQSTMNHARLSTKKEFYPYMIEAYKSGIVTYEFPLFEDKLNTDMHRRQYYGTQVVVNSKGEYILAPVYNIDSLDLFRKEVELEPINMYLQESFKVEWNIDEYNRKVDSLKKALKLNDSMPLRFIKERKLKAADSIISKD